MKKRERVHYQKPSKIHYLKGMLKVIPALIKDCCKLFAYYGVNHTLGKQASKIGKNSNVHATTIFRQGRNIIIGERCFINHNAMLQGGKVDAKIKIGNDVLIGANVMMYAYNHGFYTRDTPMNVQDYFEADIVIEDDVQICAGAIILAGVHIGKGAVIGAGSVVNSDVPEYAIAAGVPAKVVKMRP